VDIEEILRELEFHRGYFPRETVEAAVAQREAITPHLLKLLEHACDNAEHLDDDAEETGAYMAHIHAMYLLAQFRERAAYPLIVRFFSLPGELSLDLTGDVATEDLPNILASVSCGDTNLMKEMVANPALNEWGRSAAVRAFLSLLVAGEASREQVIAYYAELFRGKLERECSNVWNSLASSAADLAAADLREDVSMAYGEGLVEPFFMTPEEAERDLMRDERLVLPCLRRQRYGLIEDTVRELQRWACFREEHSYGGAAGAQRPEPSWADPDLPDEDIPPFREPFGPVRAEPLPGRNDPCPCGSGRKYKRCCARKPSGGS